MSFRRVLGGCETCARERFEETTLRFRRPERDATSRLQRFANSLESAPGIKTRVVALHERSRPVVHVQKNRVVRRARRATDERENIFSENLDAWIVDQCAVHGVENLAVPRADIRDQPATCTTPPLPTSSSTRLRLKPNPRPPISTRALAVRPR